jgi:hypothetical protein
VNTYGDYRDDTLNALACLLTEPTAPSLTTAQLSRVLDCRDSVLVSLRQQFRLATGQAGTGSLRLPSVEANPTAAFGTVLADLPRTGPGQAPTDVLTPPDENPYVARWQEAGRSALLATDVLDTTHAWRGEPTAAWAVVAEVAKAAIALPILDTQLAQLAHAADDEQAAKLLTRSATSGLVLTARLTADTARQGSLHGGMARLTRPHVGRVEPRPLSRFAEAPAGQHQVAQILQQRQGLLPVKALAAVLLGQARIAAAIDDSASRLQPPHTPDGWLNRHERDTAAALAGAARARAEALRQVARAHKGVADTLGGGQPAVWATAEVLRALQRRTTPRDRADAREQLRELQQLAARGDAVHTLLAQGIRRAFATGDYLVPHPERNQLQWRPCTADAESPLRNAAEVLDRARQRAALPRLLEAETTHRPATAVRISPDALVDAVAARMSGRPTSPGMNLGQPLSP